MNKHDDVDWGRLGRFVSGECSETEEAEVRAWLRGDSGRERLLEEVRWVLEHVDDPEPELDAAAAWERFEARIKQPDIIPLPTASTPKRTGDRQRRRRMPAMAAGVGALVAAAVLALLGPSVWGGGAEDVHVFSTAPGQKGTVRLGEGTTIRLGFDSELRILPGYGRQRREVRLDGEAFFDVGRDTQRPFIIHAQGSRTRVLGTRFVVTAYPDGDEVRVAVAEGSVALGGSKDITEASAQLRSGQLGVWTGSSDDVRVEEVNVAVHLAWLEDRLIFDDEPLQSVTRRLSRWYGVDVVLDDPALGERRFTASLDDPSLSEVIQLLTLTFALTHERADGAIVLKSAASSASRTLPKESA